MTTPVSDIGLIGLAVMGENLALNIESKGFPISVYNRTAAKVEAFINGRAKGKNFVGATDLKDRDPNLVNLLVDPFFREALETRQGAWRRAIVQAVQLGIPVPCLSAALAYFDGYRTDRLQAQRDYFGAHTYERTDKPRGEFFHTNWTGRGGSTTSQTYTV